MPGVGVVEEDVGAFVFTGETKVEGGVGGVAGDEVDAVGDVAGVGCAVFESADVGKVSEVGQLQGAEVVLGGAWVVVNPDGDGGDVGDGGVQGVDFGVEEWVVGHGLQEGCGGSCVVGVFEVGKDFGGVQCADACDEWGVGVCGDLSCGLDGFFAHGSGHVGGASHGAEDRDGVGAVAGGAGGEALEDVNVESSLGVARRGQVGRYGSEHGHLSRLLVGGWGSAEVS